MGVEMALFQTMRPPRGLDRTLTTPAIEGLALHETLYGSMARRGTLKNLLIAALVVGLGYTIVQLSFYANKTRYIPYILLQHEDGSAHVLSGPDPHWSPNDAMARADVRDLVYTLRGILLDPTENTRRWERVLARVTEPRGRQHAEAAYWDLKNKQWRGAIQVDIQTILTRQELQTYEVLWTETRYDENKDRDKTPQGVTRWRGIFTVKFDPAAANPNTVPDGIRYDAWTISQEER